MEADADLIAELARRLRRLDVLVLFGEQDAAESLLTDDLAFLEARGFTGMSGPPGAGEYLVTIERVNDWFSAPADNWSEWIDSDVTRDVDATVTSFTNSLSRYYVVSDVRDWDSEVWSLVCVGRRPDDDKDTCFAIEARPLRPDPPNGK